MTAVEAHVEDKPAKSKRTSSQVLAVHKPAPPAPMTSQDIIMAAVQSGNVEMYERGLAMFERMEANQARKAFNNALADAKAKMPILKKNRLVDFTNNTGKQTTYRHEDLAEVVRTVVPLLSEFGLFHRYRLQNKPGEPISVTCIISHRDGYFEENELSSAADTSGGKNAIQAVKSAVTYLERITLLASLGLAASEDDDGRASEGVPATITAIQLQELEKLIAEVGADSTKACAALHIESLAEMPASKFEKAKAKLETMKVPL